MFKIKSIPFRVENLLIEMQIFLTIINGFISKVFC